MKQEFNIKLQGKQYAKRHGRLVFMLLCFIVSIVILMMYSSRYFIALMAPVFYLILRLKNVSAEKNFLTDAVCTVITHDFGVVLSIKSAQSKLCETYNVLYSTVNDFSVCGRKVSVCYTSNEKGKLRNRIIEFHILPNDVVFWCELSNKFSK
ncbi:MAG: hypothetical protein E7538_01730 [Ruminococcaceae bacterium]|nr:hypothetical protein [Oscillospiraceae bacterium]